MSAGACVSKPGSDFNLTIIASWESRETKFSLLCPFSWLLAEAAIGDRCKHGAGQTDAAIYFAWLLSLSLSALQLMCFAVFSVWCALAARSPTLDALRVYLLGTNKKGPCCELKWVLQKEIKVITVPRLRRAALQSASWTQNGARHKQTLNAHTANISIFAAWEKT